MMFYSKIMGLNFKQAFGLYAYLNIDNDILCMLMTRGALVYIRRGRLRKEESNKYIS